MPEPLTLAEKVAAWKAELSEAAEAATEAGAKAETSRNLEFPKDTRASAGAAGSAFDVFQSVLGEVLDELEALAQRVEDIENE
jgi:hypothetical protein